MHVTRRMKKPFWFSAPLSLRAGYIGYRLATSLCRKRWDYDSSKIVAIIIVRDLWSNLKPLTDQFRKQGIPLQNIWLIDTGSTNEDCHATLRSLQDQGCRVEKLSRQEAAFGPYGPWMAKSLRIKMKSLNYPFILTDPDLAFTERCPKDWLAQTFNNLMRYGYVSKIGLPLSTKNIDEKLEERVKNNQSQLYSHWLLSRISKALVNTNKDGQICATDTTLALYRPRTPFSTLAIRMPEEYELIHLPWLSTYRQSVEFKYYTEKKLHCIGEWS
jgi:hypothetical protein